MKLNEIVRPLPVGSISEFDFCVYELYDAEKLSYNVEGFVYQPNPRLGFHFIAIAVDAGNYNMQHIMPAVSVDHLTSGGRIQIVHTMRHAARLIELIAGFDWDFSTDGMKMGPKGAQMLEPMKSKCREMFAKAESEAADGGFLYGVK